MPLFRRIRLALWFKLVGYLVQDGPIQPILFTGSLVALTANRASIYLHVLIAAA